MKRFYPSKKMAFLAAITLSLAFLAKGFSSLAPLPQSIREIEAILSHEILQLPELTSEVIWEIEKTERGYLLKTTHFVIPVEIIKKLPSEHLGPTPFEVSIDHSLIAGESRD